MNQSYRRLIVAFILLVIGAVGAHWWMTKTPANQQEAVDRMLASNTNVDNKILGGDVDNAEPKPTQSAQDKTFSALYDETNKDYDPLRAYHLAKSLYQQQDDAHVTSLVIRRGIDVYDFSWTFALLGQLDEEGRLHEWIVTPEQYLLVLFNAVELSQAHLARIEKIIDSYAQDNLLNDAQKRFYVSLLAYAQGDIDGFLEWMAWLKWTSYDDRAQRVEIIKAQVYGFVDPPKYYIDGMLWLEMFSKGWYQLAITAGERVTKLDPVYILGHQLIWYGAFYLWDRRRSYEELERLKELDKTHSDLYLFLEWITLFQLEDYPTALFSFLEVKDSSFRTDTLRYLLLTYNRLADITKEGEVMWYLLKQPDIGPYDFFTVFDLFFFDPIRRGEDVLLFAEHFELASQWLQRCYEKGKNDYSYVCLYGKAWLLLSNGEDVKAMTYLERLVHLYPSAALYEKLWDIAYKQGYSKQAKEYFLQSLSLSSQSLQQQSLQQKIQNIKK